MKDTNISYKMLDPDNCAMCGMCLNYCPTYKISNNESESPRGRISIIHGLNESMLEPSNSALKHINSCTLCMACESTCPAKVDFYNLMTTARNKYFKNQKLSFKFKTNLISLFLTNRFLKKLASYIFHFLNREFFQYLNNNIFKFMSYVQSYQKTYTINTKLDAEASVGIFTGCATDLFQKEVANNCVDILKKNNINSELIKNVKCCGSLDYNSGRIDKGIKYNKSAIKEFNNKKYKNVIGYASGCSSFINKSKQDTNYQDATTYILNLLDSSNENNFRITKKNICVHMPCTTKSAEIDFNKLLRILKKIPGINIFTFEDNYCCGAGAQNLIHNSENSHNIIDPKIEFLKENKIDSLLTYNIGCSLNFINSINSSNDEKIKVLHPITFLNNMLV